MRSLLQLFFLQLLLVAVAVGQPRGGPVANLIANNGQWPAEARYLLRSAGMDSWLTDQGILLDRYSITSNGTSNATSNGTQRRGHVVRMEFVGGNLATSTPVGQLQARHNYLIGNNPAAWVTGVAAYQQVRCANVYAGVDALFYQDAGQLRYDLVVNPGADPSAIRLRFTGATTLHHTGSALQIGTTLGVIEQSGLVAYQVADGVRRVVPCWFVQHSDSTVGFRAEQYDRTQPLVIDPLIYSTFIGGPGSDNIAGLAADADGNPVVCGSTVSLLFPTTTGAYNTANNGIQDIVVVRLDSSGSAVIYSTYIGGAGLDAGKSVESTPDGTAWITGYTDSQDFPTTTNGAQKSSGGERDAFLLALNPAGTALSYSTYLGGSVLDEGEGVALDSSGGVVVVGTTSSPDFPTTPQAFDKAKSTNIFDTDLFIARIGGDGGVRFASFLGGEQMERGAVVATNREGDILVTGQTSSPDFPTTSVVADNSHNGNADAFLSRLDSSGTQLLNSGFVGGEQDDAGYGIAIGPDGNPYLCGYTRSDSFPTTFLSADTVFNGNTDAFVVRFNNDGSRMRYGLFLGGVQGEVATAIAVDSRGSAHVVGGTYSQFFPAGGAVFDPDFNGTADAFLVKFSPFGGSRAYSTFIGGTQEDYAYGVRLDREGNAIVAGRTQSPEFPKTPNAADTGFNGSSDFFITKLTIEDETVGVDDGNNSNGSNGAAAEITIAPNPSSGLLQISIPPGIAVAQVQIFNAVGVLLMRHRLGGDYRAGLTLDCSRFLPGLYLVEISTTNGKIERRPVMLQ